MSLDYLHGPGISISVPTTARQESQRHKRVVGGGRGDDGSRSQREESEGVVLLALKMEEGAVSQGLQVPLEAGNGENSNSTLEPPEGMQACKHPVRTILRL